MITHLSQSNGSCASERGNDHVSIEEQVAVGAGAPDYGAASLCELPGPLPTPVISEVRERAPFTAFIPLY